MNDLFLGPLGMCLEVREEMWILAVEQALGRFIDAFACANYQDERLLHELLAKHVRDIDRRPRVLVCDFNQPLYDVSRLVSLLFFFVVVRYTLQTFRK
jgi:hypothetical protein